MEYQVAAHLISKGYVEQGLAIVRSTRSRYNGRARNPYNEYECGHWYQRALASYSLLQACTGIRYDAVTGILAIEPRIEGDFTSFLSTAFGYGVAGVKKTASRSWNGSAVRPRCAPSATPLYRRGKELTSCAPIG